MLTPNSTKLKQSWRGSVVGSESTFHQLSPYLGKMKSEMAKTLISSFSNEGDWIFDPFCGSGTIALEGWIQGRNVVANDLNPYACLLTNAKLFPPVSLHETLIEFEKSRIESTKELRAIDLRKVPLWIRHFFHSETLREIIAWKRVLLRRKSYFILTCLLGILHHQRPGFLSFPSSHAVPYLRNSKFPRTKFPKLYEYRSVSDRLERKIRRAFKRAPSVNSNLQRLVYEESAEKIVLDQKVDLILTSPPYMRNLDYGRDNRLRLWLINTVSWKELDKKVSPKEIKFLKLIEKCFENWIELLKTNGYCIIVVGDIWSSKYNSSLQKVIIDLATKNGSPYKLVSVFSENIPQSRRIRRDYRGSNKESIIIFQKRDR